MSATWRRLGTLCRERDWSKRRLIHELRNGLLYRTIPPGHTIDWHDPNVAIERVLDVEASEVTLNTGPVTKYGDQPQITLGIEVIPPDDAELPSPSANAPAATAIQTPLPSKEVTDKELRDCILAIKDKQPDDPPNEENLWVEVEERLRRPVSRDRVRAARGKAAPQWVKPRGRPRKPAQ